MKQEKAEPVNSRPFDVVTFPKMIGEFVKREREDRGWSQRRLSSEANVAQGFVSAIEAGRGNPSWSTWIGICTALGISYPELVVKAVIAANGELSPSETKKFDRIARLLAALMQREELE